MTAMERGTVLKTALLAALFLTFLACVDCLCNSLTQYTLVDKLGKEICPSCQDCDPGYELIIKCGSVINDDTKTGLCQRCKNGTTYSAKRDVEQCKICQQAKCLEHEKVEGTCEPDKIDTSHCMGVCEEDYIMNRNKTVCEPAGLQLNTTKSDAKMTKKLPSTSREGLVTTTTTAATTATTTSLARGKTDRKTSREIQKWPSTSPGLYTTKHPRFRTKGLEGQSTGKSSLSAGMIAFLTVLSLLIVVGTCWCLKKRREIYQNVINCHCLECFKRNVHNVTPNNDPGIIFQPTAQFQNDALHIDITVRPSEVMPQIARQDSHPLKSRFEGLSFLMYDEICETFNLGASGKDWRALSDPLGFVMRDVQRFEAKENPTDEILKKWTAKKENDVAKFMTIVSKMGMTYLASRINEHLNQQQHFQL